MVKINRIYTRTGDAGDTGLVGGQRTSKDSLRVASYGEVDELNSQLGVVRTLLTQELAQKHSEAALKVCQIMERIQHELFDLGAELATPPGAEWPGMKKVSLEDVTQLERWIDESVAELPELTSFVLPGGTLINAHLHLARAICRRAERVLVELVRSVDINKQILSYVNRLSDLLFALARFESARAGVPEFLWVPKRS